MMECPTLRRWRWHHYIFVRVDNTTLIDQVHNTQDRTESTNTIPLHELVTTNQTIIKLLWNHKIQNHRFCHSRLNREREREIIIVIITNKRRMKNKIVPSRSPKSFCSGRRRCFCFCCYSRRISLLTIFRHYLFFFLLRLITLVSLLNDINLNYIYSSFLIPINSIFLFWFGLYSYFKLDLLHLLVFSVFFFLIFLKYHNDISFWFSFF